MRLIFIWTILLVCKIQLNAEGDLYNVLGVRKTASSAEIKKAYKRLAREWHPDKNNAPGANDHFMKINEAYETLTDAEKRSQYDNFGTTSAHGNQHQRSGGHQFHGFDGFFHQGGFPFNFGGFHSDSAVEKQRVTLRAYTSKILPESREKPYLLYAYSDFCYNCMQVEHIWEKVAQDMESIGVGIGTVQVQMDRPLTNKIRISSVPSIVGVINGKLHYFKGHYNVQDIRNFVRRFFPSDTVAEIDDGNFKTFLAGWSDNRVRMMFFDNRKEPTLRYLAAAFQYKDRVSAGYINLQGRDTSILQSQFNIQSGMETLLMFNEEMKRPTATLTMKQLPRSSLDQMIEANQFLQLPRLSSHTVFNQLCPPMSLPQRKKLCVVLLSWKTKEHDGYRESFRQYAAEHQDPQERVRYVYVYEDSQYHFVNKLTNGEGVVNKTTLKVAVVWRRDPSQLHYDFLENGWPLDGEDLRQSRRKLHRLVDWFLSGSAVLPFSIDLPGELIDEYAEGLLWRIMKRLMNWADRIWEKITNADDVTFMTLGMSVIFIVVIGYMMRTLASVEEDSLNRTRRWKEQTQAQHPNEKSQPARPTLFMHQLTAETIAPLILNSEAGVRTLLILVDEDSQPQLLQKFAHIVLPYSRSDAFKFAMLRLESHIKWYRHLLEETLEFKRKLDNINQRNCIGTVLAINGQRKYYCIYHAQQEQTARREKASGDFMGFDDDDDDSQLLDREADKLFLSDLLDGLDTWMDRLCEGTLRRFRVQYWPEIEDSLKS